MSIVVNKVECEINNICIRGIAQKRDIEIGRNLSINFNIPENS